MTYEFWVPAAPVREHVNKLRAFGIGQRQIALLANVPYQCVKELVGGNTNTRGQATQRITNGAARRLLAVEMKYENVADNKTIPSKASVRRIQALCAIGYSLNWQADKLKTHPQTLLFALRRDRITNGMAKKVETLFNAYAFTPKVGKSKIERRGIAKTKNHAKRNGWVGAAFWENIELDDAPRPLANHRDYPQRIQSAIDGNSPRFAISEYSDAIRDLSAAGLTQAQMATILNVSAGTIRNIKNQKGQKWNPESTEQN